MKSFLFLTLVVLVCVSKCYCTDLVIGTTYNTQLAWQHKADYMGFPFKKRVKEVFYSDSAQRIIKAVVARDIEHTQAIASITSGGVGFPYVNLRLKSERGSGIHYQIEVYV